MNSAPSDRTVTYLERLLGVLVHIQTHLDEDLSLTRLAGIANYSPHHFHRVFRETIGETVKAYVQRIRLERAAVQLRCRRATILEIALDTGFESHETFTRAFQRRFGLAPNRFRRTFLPSADQPRPSNRISLNTRQKGYVISRPSIQILNPIDLAFIRNLGPYRQVDPGLFERLLEWGKLGSQLGQGAVLLGIGHDAPGITAPEKLRFDACLQVAGPFPTEGEISHQTLPAGPHAVTTYIGPFDGNLEAAYAEIFAQLGRLREYEILGLPVVEFYHTTHIDPDYALNQTEVCIPVRKRAFTKKGGDPS